jgi:16S rRNA (uracil1498-N3)-methyltransferase
MAPRFFVDLPLASSAPRFTLPGGAARHVQVLRLQPGDALTLFDGRGGEWAATVASMTRGGVEVELGAFDAVEREARLAVTLAIGMPANDRMDGFVEKATELAVAAIQPLVCARSVLRLAGDRAAKKLAHWQGIARAAAEQSGRTRVPALHPVRALDDWLTDESLPATRWLLSPRAARPLALPAPDAPLVVLSGPEGGLDGDEETRALAAGFVAVSLGARILRADTAPLAVLASVTLGA